MGGLDASGLALSALWAVHHATTLLFGVFVSAVILDIDLDRRHVIELLGVCAVTGGAFALASAWGGELLAKQLYPLLVHIPLAVFLVLRHHKSTLLVLLAVTTAYLACQVSNWVGLFALTASGSMAVYYAARIATTLIVFAILMRHLPPLAVQLADKTPTELGILLMLPLVYYIFDYATNVYTTLLHSGSVVTVEFLAFALCIFYVLFLAVYLREYEAKEAARRESWMVETRAAQATKELDAWRRSGRELSVLRHDMRHYLRGIGALLDEGEVERAREQLDEICSAVEHTAVRRHSANETVNIALSSFDDEIARCGIDARLRAAVPAELPVAEVDLFSVLSNALENAVTAAAAAPEGRRHVDLDLVMGDGKLLLEISNTFGTAPRMADGMPVAHRTGHGFGTQSIKLACERMGGNCQFSVAGNRFILRAVL